MECNHFEDCSIGAGNKNPDKIPPQTNPSVVTCRPSSGVESLGNVNEHNPTDGWRSFSRKSNVRFDFQRTGQKRRFEANV